MFFAWNLKRKMSRIVSDVNFKALMRTRGLHELTNDLCNQQGFCEYPPLRAHIVCSDALNKASATLITPLPFPIASSLRVGLPFRLTAITPPDKVKSFVRDCLENTDICALHFLEDNPMTLQT